MIKQIVVAFIAVACLVGCASQQLTVKTDTAYKKVWQACIDSMPEMGYSVESTDPTSGLIIAQQQSGFGHGRAAKMNISVSEESGTTTVIVRYIPLPDQIGGSGTAEKYVAALKKRVPGIQPVVAK